MLNKQSGVTLINNSKQRCPMARINIDCQFFRGNTDALCIDDPAHDLVIGNIEGSKFPDITHFSSGVVKNIQSRKDRRKNRKVKVADKFIRQNRQELCMKQASDIKLKEIRRRVESGSDTMSRGFSSGETKFIRRNGLIYRHFKKNGKVSLQLVIPSSLTHSVINLAHESLRVLNHRGRKETISMVLDEFYWPGVCREVTQFCRSCAICQRTTHNIKVASTHCCSVPQRNISSKEAVVSRTRRTESQTERRRSYGSGRRCPIPYYWRGCAGWSAPVLFANPRRQAFSRRGPNNVWTTCIRFGQCRSTIIFHRSKGRLSSKRIDAFSCSFPSFSSTCLHDLMLI